MIRRSPIVRKVRLVRHAPNLSRTAPPKANPERQKRRAAAYQARLHRADWKAKRIATFERDGWRCVRVVAGQRCPNGRANGTALHCNHRTYARFGHELPEDLETLCACCDRI